MVRRAYRQRSLVEVLLPDGDKLWDSTLRQIDTLLDDDVLVDRVAEALARRHPQSRRRGRLGTPATVVLRMLVLKHLSDWSFDECEREVRGSPGGRAPKRAGGGGAVWSGDPRPRPRGRRGRPRGPPRGAGEKREAPHRGLRGHPARGLPKSRERSGTSAR